MKSKEKKKHYLMSVAYIQKAITLLNEARMDDGYFTNSIVANKACSVAFKGALLAIKTYLVDRQFTPAPKNPYGYLKILQDVNQRTRADYYVCLRYLYDQRTNANCDLIGTAIKTAIDLIDKVRPKNAAKLRLKDFQSIDSENRVIKQWQKRKPSINKMVLSLKT